MKVFQVVIFALLIGYAVPSISSEWYVIPGTHYEGDWSRMKVDNSGNVSMWIKSVTSPEVLVKIRNRNNYIDYDHSISYWIIDCKQGTLVIKNGIEYGARGRVIESWTNPNGFEPIAPDTAGEMVFKAVCPKLR